MTYKVEEVGQNVEGEIVIGEELGIGSGRRVCQLLKGDHLGTEDATPLGRVSIAVR